MSTNSMFNYTSTSKFNGSSYKTGTELYNLVSQVHSKLTFSAHDELTKNTKLKELNKTIKKINKATKVYENNKSIFTSSNTLSSDGKSLLNKPTNTMYLNMKNARANLRTGKKYIKLSYYQKEIADCNYFIDYANDAIAKSKSWSKLAKKYQKSLHFETVTGSATDYDYMSKKYVTHKTTGKKLVFPNYKKAIEASNKVMSSSQISIIEGWINSATKKRYDAQSRFTSIFNGGK